MPLSHVNDYLGHVGKLIYFSTKAQFTEVASFPFKFNIIVNRDLLSTRALYAYFLLCYCDGKLNEVLDEDQQVELLLSNLVCLRFEMIYDKITLDKSQEGYFRQSAYLEVKD